MIDTHAHLNATAFENDWEAIVQRFESDGIEAVVNVAYDLESTRRSLWIREQYPSIFPTAGIHPHDAAQLTEQAQAELRKLADLPDIFAIGESGLDFYRNLCPVEDQKTCFDFHIQLAIETQKPLIIHSRDAFEAIMDMLWGYRGRVFGLFHTFSGTEADAKRVLDLGFHISLSGTITYKNSLPLRQIIPLIPLDRLLVETDCPYLTPHPHRGKRNEPAYLRYVVDCIAREKNLDSESISEITGKNARNLFQF